MTIAPETSVNMSSVSLLQASSTNGSGAVELEDMQPYDHVQAMTLASHDTRQYHNNSANYTFRFLSQKAINNPVENVRPPIICLEVRALGNRTNDSKMVRILRTVVTDAGV